MAKKKITKHRVPRTRNHKTMTESAFWGGIRSALRQKSRWWKPSAEAKKASRRFYKGPNKRQKWEFQCAKCKKWYKDKEVAVDHIIPAGALKSSDDLKGFVDRLFCEIDGFQILCGTCHNTKTKKENSDRRKINKK